MQRRCILDSHDIDNIVRSQSQAEILKDIATSKLRLAFLSEENKEERFYWDDRLRAYQLAYDISLWYEPEIFNDDARQILLLQGQVSRQKTKIESLEQKMKPKGKKGLGF